MNTLNRRTMIGGAAALGAAAAAGIPAVQAAINAADSAHPIIRHACVIDGFLKARPDLMGCRVGEVRACDSRLNFIPSFSPKGGMRLEKEIMSAFGTAAESRPDAEFGTISVMSIGFDLGSRTMESGARSFVTLIDDDGSPGNRVSELHNLGKGKSSMRMSTHKEGRKRIVESVLVMNLDDHSEAGLNGTMKTFGAFLHHLYGEPDWVPEWATSGEHQPEFAARIVNDRRRSTWIA